MSDYLASNASWDDLLSTDYTQLENLFNPTLPATGPQPLKYTEDATRDAHDTPPPTNPATPATPLLQEQQYLNMNYVTPATPLLQEQQYFNMDIANTYNVASLGNLYQQQQGYNAYSTIASTHGDATLRNVSQQQLHYELSNPATPASLLQEPYNMNQILQYQEQQFPIMPPGPPDTDVFEGPYKFGVEIDPITKKYYFYKNLLRLLLESTFSLTFNYDNAEGGPNYVRACVCFQLDASAGVCVETCPVHNKAIEDTTLNKSQWHNVLHTVSNNGLELVHYDGDKATNTWFSSVVKFKPERTKRTQSYKFVCRNTCLKGINRRPIMMVFTLEDQLGKVYGRQIIPVKISMHPRRDISKKIFKDAASPKPRPEETIVGPTQGTSKRRTEETIVGPIQGTSKRRIEETVVGLTQGTSKRRTETIVEPTQGTSRRGTKETIVVPTRCSSKRKTKETSVGNHQETATSRKKRLTRCETTTSVTAEVPVPENNRLDMVLLPPIALPRSIAHMAYNNMIDGMGIMKSGESSNENLELLQEKIEEIQSAKASIS